MMKVSEKTNSIPPLRQITGHKKKPQLRAVNILGVRLHDVSMEETLSCIESMATDGEPHQVVTVNPEFVMIAQRNDMFRTVLNEASLALPDGMGILWAAKFLGRRLRHS